MRTQNKIIYLPQSFHSRSSTITLSQRTTYSLDCYNCIPWMHLRCNLDEITAIRIRGEIPSYIVSPSKAGTLLHGSNSPTKSQIHVRDSKLFGDHVGLKRSFLQSPGNDQDMICRQSPVNMKFSYHAILGCVPLAFCKILHAEVLHTPLWCRVYQEFP